MNLSIIIPAYNCEKYIEECIYSILDEIKEQNDIEVLLIDDGSTDNTYKLCEKFISKNFKIFKNKNHGVSFSRNYGINRASGKYIMFIDADDTLNPGWLKKIRNEIKPDSDIIYISGNIVNRKKDKNLILQEIIGLKTDNKTANFASACSKLYSRDLLQKYKINFDNKIINGEDMIFNVEVLLKANKISYINKSIYKYRINYSSATHIFNDKIFKSDRNFHNKLNKILIDNKIDRNIIEEISEFCLFNSIYMLLYRISFTKYSSARKYSDFLKEEPYNLYIIKYVYKRKDGFRGYIINLLKNKHYKIVYFLIKTKNLILNTKSKVNKKKWKEI